MNFKLIWEDALVTVGLVCNFLAQWLTIFLTSTLKNIVDKTKYLEINPIQQVIQSFQFVNIYWLVFTWAIILGLYVYMRRRRNIDANWEVSFDVVAFFLFLMLFRDVLGDSAVVLGVLFGG